MKYKHYQRFESKCNEGSKVPLTAEGICEAKSLKAFPDESRQVMLTFFDSETVEDSHEVKSKRK
jgi:hypothetical protein